MRDPLTYGLAAMFLFPLLGFFPTFWRIKALEELTDNIKSKSAEIIEAPVEVDGENEMAALQLMFNSLYNELQDKMLQLNSYSKKLINSNVKLSELAITDSLTDLFNKRHFQLRLTEEVSRAKRHNLDLALIMIDVDFFKQYNDTLGHQAGDKMLRYIGLMIRKSIRESDLAFRYGGDEFAVLLPQCGLKNAKEIARQLVDAVERIYSKPHGRVPRVKISISCGVAQYNNKGVEEFVAKADKCLYKAKARGRGRVVA
ncbi:MAG: GGDEF domain-containing protein [Thermodesulfobacteriota bacterium]|nr:GGDEF domain-containing protein [Thermodesulfobacteriota bacterium]